MANTKLNGLILAGGKSSRMGYDKSSIVFHQQTQEAVFCLSNDLVNDLHLYFKSLPMNYFIHKSKFYGLVVLLFLTCFFFFDIFMMIGSGYQILIPMSIFLVLLSTSIILYKKTDGYSSIPQMNTKA